MLRSERLDNKTEGLGRLAESLFKWSDCSCEAVHMTQHPKELFFCFSISFTFKLSEFVSEETLNPRQVFNMHLPGF